MCPAGFLLPSIASNEHEIEVRDGNKRENKEPLIHQTLLMAIIIFLAGCFLPYRGPVCQ